MKRTETMRLEELRLENERIEKSSCPGITKCCITCGKTHCYKFHCSNVGFTCNLLCSHAVFWPLGFLAVLEYGYGDTYSSMRVDGAEQLAVASGRAGQGSFPVMIMCCGVSTFLYLFALIAYIVKANSSSDEDDE